MGPAGGAAVHEPAGCTSERRRGALRGPRDAPDREGQRRSHHRAIPVGATIPIAVLAMPAITGLIAPSPENVQHASPFRSSGVKTSRPARSARRPGG
jgi:hypothetical protein